MQITVLVDNHTYIDHYYLGEPGFCCLIEDGPHTVLFDTGFSDIFMENACRMGIDLSRVTDIAISHGHNDHTGGLGPYFSVFKQPINMYLHPRALYKKRSHGLDIGAPEIVIPQNANVIFSKKPVRISEHIVFLGEIPRRHDFEANRGLGRVLFMDGQWVNDDLADDTSLMLNMEGADGVLLTGCAHSGVCNAFDAASDIGPSPKAIIGGMHLFDADHDFYAAMDYLRHKGVKRMYPAHCTSLKVKAEIDRIFGAAYEVGVGLRMDIKGGQEKVSVI